MPDINDANIADLKRKRRIVINNKNALSKRKKQVEDVYYKSFDMDDCAGMIDKNINAFTGAFSAGITGISKTFEKTEAVEDLKEKNALSAQPNFGSAIGYMYNEIKRLENEIRNLETQQISYENKIRSAGGHIFPWD